MERFVEFDDELFKPPADENVSIWRYMDFTRFVSLLNSGSLHLTRCDQFDDHFEGTATKREDDPNGFLRRDSLPSEQLPTVLEKLWKKYQRQYVFINCWHINKYESAAMWRSYTRSNNTIAVQTTYQKLRNALPACFQIGEVKYIDHQTYVKNEKGGFFTVMCKRKSFEHERELRICYVDAYEFQQDSYDPRALVMEANTRLYETVSVDLQSLIESIRVAPEAPAWLLGLVKDVVIRFGYTWPVGQSSFDEYPFC